MDAQSIPANATASAALDQRVTKIEAQLAELLQVVTSLQAHLVGMPTTQANRPVVTQSALLTPEGTLQPVFSKTLEKSFNKWIGNLDIIHKIESLEISIKNLAMPVRQNNRLSGHCGALK